MEVHLAAKHKDPVALHLTFPSNPIVKQQQSFIASSLQLKPEWVDYQVLIKKAIMYNSLYLLSYLDTVLFSQVWKLRHSEPSCCLLHGISGSMGSQVQIIRSRVYYIQNNL